MKPGDTYYVLKATIEWRPYQIKCQYVRTERVPKYGGGHTNISIFLLKDGTRERAYWFTDVGVGARKRRRTFRKTPLEGIPVFETYEQINKFKTGTVLICIKDNCPITSQMVDWRKCSKCVYHAPVIRHTEEKIGTVQCAHPEAESDPDDSRWDAMKQHPGVLSALSRVEVSND